MPVSHVAGQIWSGLLRIACAVAFFATSATTPLGAFREHSWTRAGVLRFAITEDPHSLNPILARDSFDETLNELSFDFLVGTDDAGRPFPELAQLVPSRQNGGVSRDGLTVTYHLRHGVRWQDGQPFTSRDVAFSYAAVENPRNDVVGRSTFDAVASVATPDSYTVVVRLKHRSSPILSQFFGASDQPIHVAPAHLLEKLPDINAAAFNVAPIGTGPFKVVRWDRGSRIVLEANDDYFFGKPGLRRIEMRIVPDFTTLGTQVRTHEIDLGAVDNATYYAMLDVPDIARRLAPLNGYASYTFNLQRPFLRDFRVRRAVAFALDRQTIVSKISYGLAVVASADIPPQSWAHDPDVVRYGYDPARSRALLDAAGWHIGAEGIRQRTGVPLVLELAEPAAVRGEDIQVQAMLRAVGIRLEIKRYPTALLYAPARAGGIVMHGTFDLLGGSWVAGTDPDNSSQFMCSSPLPANASRYCNAEVDAAERDQLNTDDLARRKRDFAVIERHVTTDLPILPLSWPRVRYVMNVDFRGFAPNGIGPAWNAYRWSI